MKFIGLGNNAYFRKFRMVLGYPLGNLSNYLGYLGDSLGHLGNSLGIWIFFRSN
jgi:hypothetical protein